MQVHVYDLAENKHDALCAQKIVKKAKLTKIAFNPKHPILIVGDDRYILPLLLTAALHGVWSTVFKLLLVCVSSTHTYRHSICGWYRTFA